MLDRWSVRWGGLFLIAVTALVVALPLLLLWPAASPPRAPVGGGARAVTSRPAPFVAGPATLPAAPVRERPAPPPIVTTGGDQDETEPSGPIVEVERVQGQSAAPSGPLPPVTTRPATPEQLDRSPEARERGVAEFGGTPQTENAVEAGLNWLAAHQSPEGIWDRFHFADLDPDRDRCTGHAIRRTEVSLDAGLTGLCLLAFLGAGYTDERGPYQRVVERAVTALLNMQQPDGGFGPGPDDEMAGYNDSLATFALAEHYAMTRQPRLVEPLQRAVGRLVRAQQALGGWDYRAWPDIGRNDTSITAWVVQALHACAAAGIEVPRRTLVLAALHFSRATQPDGRVWYADAGTGYELDASGRPEYRFGPSMTAAGLTCTQLLGWRMDGAMPRRQAALLLARPPSTGLARGRDPTELHSEYYWYYGTVAMFQRGGRDWERWNAVLRDTILPLQNRPAAGARRRSADGSWDPYGSNGAKWGKWGEMGSRVYTTAICVLTLEIYYRHTPAYLTEDVLLGVADWRAYLAEANARQRLDAVSCLAALRYESAEVVLVELLSDPDHRVATAAAEALAWNDNPLGLALLDDVVSRLPPWGRHSTERALERARALTRLPAVEGVVRTYDAGRRLATLELPRAYVGMSVSVRHGGREVGQMRVVQRYSGRTVVVAELLTSPRESPPQAGDTVIAR
ncbi:MAG: prenyltransferase/squalene oxidase repeat-containing protein [Phycisphaerae bacterium]|jgi:hypothetical protein